MILSNLILDVERLEEEINQLTGISAEIYSLPDRYNEDIIQEVIVLLEKITEKRKEERLKLLNCEVVLVEDEVK